MENIRTSSASGRLRNENSQVRRTTRSPQERACRGGAGGFVRAVQRALQRLHSGLFEQMAGWSHSRATRVVSKCFLFYWFRNVCLTKKRKSSSSCNAHATSWRLVPLLQGRVNQYGCAELQLATRLPVGVCRLQNQTTGATWEKETTARSTPKAAAVMEKRKIPEDAKD